MSEKNKTEHELCDDFISIVHFKTVKLIENVKKAIIDDITEQVICPSCQGAGGHTEYLKGEETEQGQTYMPVNYDCEHCKGTGYIKQLKRKYQ